MWEISRRVRFCGWRILIWAEHVTKWVNSFEPVHTTEFDAFNWPLHEDLGSSFEIGFYSNSAFEIIFWKYIFLLSKLNEFKSANRWKETITWVL